MRLIDAVALLEFITSHNTNDTVANALIKIVNDQLTVDAVPVIRCKECRYMTLVDSRPFCRHYAGLIVNKEDSFCNLAVKKEEDDE